MTALLPELDAMPAGLVLDGELVAFHVGKPSFPLLCSRLLHPNSDAPVTFVAFDVLYVDGAATTSLTFAERRPLLESIEIESPVYIAPTFEDGPRGVQKLGRRPRRSLWEGLC